MAPRRIEITFSEITDSISGWARRLGISKQAMHQRLSKWPSDVAIRMGGKGVPWRGNDTYSDNRDIDFTLSPSELESKHSGLGDIIHQYSQEIVCVLFNNTEQAKINEIKLRRLNKIS